MNEYFNFRQINWQDGMKIDRNHFIESDQFHMEQNNVTRNLLLNENNFGLLPDKDKTKPANTIKLILEGELIRIVYYRISVLMLNGMLLSIDSDDLTAKNIDLERIPVKFKPGGSSEKEFYLMVKANAYDGIELGNYTSDDLLMRRPYLLSAFEFILVPDKKGKESYFGSDFLPLIKLSIRNNELVIDPEFIPPATSLLAHEALIRYHSYVYETINQIELFLLEIAKKYGNMNPESFRDTLLILSNNMLNSLARIKVEIKHILMYKSPIELIIRIKELANILYYTLTMRTSIGKDRFLNEVNKITGASKQEFEEMMKQVVNLEYRHYNISDSIAVSRDFLDQVYKILKSLSEYEKSKRSIDIIIKK
jgi:hypothetical protein